MTDRKCHTNRVGEGAGPIPGIGGNRDDADARLGELRCSAPKLLKADLSDRAVLAAINHNHLPIMVIDRFAKHQIAAAEARHGHFREAFTGFELFSHRHLFLNSQDATRKIPVSRCSSLFRASNETAERIAVRGFWPDIPAFASWKRADQKFSVLAKPGLKGGRQDRDCNIVACVTVPHIAFGNLRCSSMP